MNLKTQIIKLLKECYDPEIPVDLWSLGLIYEIDISDSTNGKSLIDITMSLTTPGCTMGQQMANDIKTKVSSIDKVDTINVTVTFDPPWKPEMMNDDARKKLGFDPIKSSTTKPKIDMEWE